MFDGVHHGYVVSIWYGFERSKQTHSNVSACTAEQNRSIVNGMLSNLHLKFSSSEFLPLCFSVHVGTISVEPTAQRSHDRTV